MLRSHLARAPARVGASPSHSAESSAKPPGKRWRAFALGRFNDQRASIAREGASFERGPKLGEAHDPLEAEASLAADAMVDEVRPTLDLRKSKPGGLPARSDSAMGLGPGRPLDDQLRGRFEPLLGEDLGRIRVHDDRAGGRLARAAGARALTMASDIAFAPGEYDPSSDRGRRLIAHELSHVAQQRRPTHDPALARAEPNDEQNYAPGETVEDFFGARQIAADATRGIERIDEDYQFGELNEGFHDLGLCFTLVPVTRDGEVLHYLAYSGLLGWAPEEIHRRREYRNRFEWIVGPDSLDHFLAHAHEYDEQPVETLAAGERLPGHPEAWTGGIQLAYLVDDLPVASGNRDWAIHVDGDLELIPHFVGEAPLDGALYYAGWSDEDQRLVYFVSPSHVDEFIANQAHYRTLAAFSFVGGDPAPWQVEEARAMQAIMRGDFGDAADHFFSAWGEALTSPGYYAYVGTTVAGSVRSMGLKPKPPAPQLVRSVPSVRPRPTTSVSARAPGSSPGSSSTLGPSASTQGSGLGGGARAAVGQGSYGGPVAQVAQTPARTPLVGLPANPNPIYNPYWYGQSTSSALFGPMLGTGVLLADPQASTDPLMSVDPSLLAPQTPEELLYTPIDPQAGKRQKRGLRDHRRGKQAPMTMIPGVDYTPLEPRDGEQERQEDPCDQVRAVKCSELGSRYRHPTASAALDEAILSLDDQYHDHKFNSTGRETRRAGPCGSAMTDFPGKHETYYSDGRPQAKITVVSCVCCFPKELEGFSIADHKEVWAPDNTQIMPP